ncbi:MAG: hypothetical protein ACRECH_07980 [Nitrososphaerales archaeon]
MSKDYLGILQGIVRASFLGDPYVLGQKRYQLKPILLEKYSVLRTIRNPANELERLIKDLPSDFRSVAKSELYRKAGGWIEQSEKSRKLMEVEDDPKNFLVPYLDQGKSVGLDTSSRGDGTSYLAVCCFNDAETGFAFLERYLELPKAKEPLELKWRKIDSKYRESVLSNFSRILNICCDAVLLIKTNALMSPEEKISDIFLKLIGGAFSGYEKMQGELRNGLRMLFFSLVNNTPIHCDSDFAPLTTDKIVRFLVKSLSSGERFVPLHVGLKSEESHPIQVSDIICGALKNLDGEERSALSSKGFAQIAFDNKLKGDQKFARVYYWINKIK